MEYRRLNDVYYRRRIRCTVRGQLFDLHIDGDLGECAEMMSESAISMLPAFVSGSPLVSVVSPEQQTSLAESTESDLPVAAIASEIAATEIVPDQTDDVLSQWGEQKWWDAIVPVAETPLSLAVEPTVEKAKSSVASAGFFGALLALAPKALSVVARTKSPRHNRLNAIKIEIAGSSVSPAFVSGFNRTVVTSVEVRRTFMECF